ncbi:MAG: type II secretion system protein [Verrucomicrobia bacterium]|nr:type II secretion system protein [Verrucomicrobiota bacterium]
MGTTVNLRRRTANAGFSLVEVVVAMLLVGIAFLAAFSAITFSRVQMFRDKELGVVTGFSLHYLELVKAMRFSDLAGGAPLNRLYDGGSNSAANIRIPSNANWFSLNDTNYLVFDPEMAWLQPRNPEMKVVLTTTKVAGVDHTKHVLVQVRWDSPLGRGQKQTARMDMVRVKDL